MFSHNSRSYDTEDDVEFIHNYYERLVLEEIMQQSSRVQVGDREFMADVACVALNRLPPRYIRHNVDMTFFMSPQDMQDIENKVTNAVAAALNYVESRELGENIEALAQSDASIESSLVTTEFSLTTDTTLAEIEIESESAKNKKAPIIKSADKKPKK